MAMESGSMSPADVAAVVDNNRGGYGYGYPFYYPSPYVYPPTVMVVPTTPPVYTQQQQVQPVQPQTDYWHYCQKPQGYYPYVKNCPGGWLQVVPQPPAQ